ncbi:Cyclin-J [Varanus komodoensis]|nr:Cyclin-J [Varanus komodoensis]
MVDEQALPNSGLLVTRTNDNSDYRHISHWVGSPLWPLPNARPVDWRKDINHLELLAVHKALISFQHVLNGKHIQVALDNMMELKLPSYKGQSPQLNLRRYFADLIAIVSNRFRLCPAARHLAVYLLDLFMDRYDISIQQLHVVALSCLLLASKFEEKEDSVPKLEQLNSLGCMTNMNLVLTKQNLLHMELLLLETFQWNLCLPTAAHFIDYYLSIAVHESDLHDGWPMVCLEKTKLYMAKYADYFLEVSLQDHAFLSYAPSLVAAACVASSRIILRLSPTWPARLHRLTVYSWDFLVPCVERLLVGGGPANLICPERLMDPDGFLRTLRDSLTWLAFLSKPRSRVEHRDDPGG